MTDTERDVFKQVLVHLIATVSLLERADKMKKPPRYAAPSNTMFRTMMEDYRRAIAAGRLALKENSDD